MMMMMTKTKKYRCIQSNSIQPQNENGTRIFRPRKSLREGNEKCIEMNFEAGINVRTKHNRNTQTYHQANESNSEYTMFSLISAQTRAIGGPEEEWDEWMSRSGDGFDFGMLVKLTAKNVFGQIYYSYF